MDAYQVLEDAIVNAKRVSRITTLEIKAKHWHNGESTITVKLSDVHNHGYQAVLDFDDTTKIETDYFPTFSECAAHAFTLLNEHLDQVT